MKMISTIQPNKPLVKDERSFYLDVSLMIELYN